MKDIKVTDSVKYIGVDDHDIDSQEKEEKEKKIRQVKRVFSKD